MDEARETKHSGGLAAVIVVLVALVLSYSGGYAYYRSKTVRVKKMQTCGPFCKGELVLTPDPSRSTRLGRVLCGLFYPAFWTEARFRGRQPSLNDRRVCQPSMRTLGINVIEYTTFLSSPYEEITPEPTEQDKATGPDAED